MVSKENEHDDFVYGYVRLDGTEVLPVKFGVKEAFDELMKRYEQLEKDDIDPEPKEDANGGKINLWRKNNENDIHAE